MTAGGGHNATDQSRPDECVARRVSSYWSMLYDLREEYYSLIFLLKVCVPCSTLELSPTGSESPRQTLHDSPMYAPGPCADVQDNF